MSKCLNTDFDFKRLCKSIMVFILSFGSNQSFFSFSKIVRFTSDFFAGLHILSTPNEFWDVSFDAEFAVRRDSWQTKHFGYKTWVCAGYKPHV